MDSEEKIQDLIMYADLEGCELGDACRAVISAYSMMEYLSEEFQTAIIKEIDSLHRMFTTEAIIVEEEATRTIKYKRLEWR